MAAVSKTTDPLLTDHMTKVQLRLIQNKLAEERDRISRASSVADSRNGSRNSSSLEHALRRQKDLLEKIKREDDRIKRPRSLNDHRKLSPIPHSPSRRSLPANSPRLPSDMGSQRHVIEHQFTQVPGMNPPAPPQQQPYQQPYGMMPQQQVQPMMAPPGQPVFVTSSPDPHRKDNSAYKQDMMEMMMFQNAQVHQMIMQQMMLSAIPKPHSTEQQMLNKVVDKLSVDRGSHHHHYPQAQNMPQPPQPYYLPPIAAPPPAYGYGRYPMEVPPLQMPRERVRSESRSPRLPKLSPKKPAIKRKLEFPGPYLLRRFRHAAYAAWFTRILRRYKRTKKRWRIPLDSDLIFNIRLRESITALHNIYRNPTGDIHRLIMFLLSDQTRDFSVIMSTKSNDERKTAVKEVSEVLQDLVKYISTIMPPDGAIGTHHKSHVTDMCREGKLFPKVYLLNIEKNLLNFDGAGRTTSINDKEIYVLLVDLFYVQSLVKTLFLKPYEYQLIEGQLHTRAHRNMKLMSTLFIHLVRRVLVPKGGKYLDLPVEMINDLHSDNDMVTAFKLVKKSLDVCDETIRKWGRAYVDKIMAVR